MKTNQIRNFKTAVIDFIRSQKLSLIFVECFSGFNHQLSLLFFKNKIWEHFLKNDGYLRGWHYPCNFLLPICLLSFGIAYATSEVSDKPIYNDRVGIAHCDIRREVNSGSIDFVSLSDAFGFSLHNAFIANRDCAFSVQNSSKIGNLSDCIFHKLEVYHNSTNKARAERLNPETSLGGCDSLNPIEIWGGDVEELSRPGDRVTEVTDRTAATVPLTDGQTPPGDQLSVTDFKAQIQWYGSFVTITDQVQYIVQDRVLNEATQVLSLQLGLTIDTLIRDMMVSTASTILCTNGLNGNTPTEITDADIQNTVIALRQGNARLMTNPLPGENKFGTSPVRSSYWGFMSVDQQADLEAVSSFISVANYPNPLNALEAEWGSTRNVRWLLNTNGYSNGASPNVYSSFVLGQEAYGVVRLGAKEAEFIVKPLGASGTADPLNQRGTVGYKYPFATRILNDNWITRLTATLASS